MFPRYRDMPAGNDISSKTGSTFLHSCISTFTVDVWFAFNTSLRVRLGNLIVTWEICFSFFGC